ncbi:MAG TPA: 4Fe-4S binding protein [Desulfobacteria bacterium]|nr:4Fe-4S binding protein [Desulfobacteria bacterium]
MFRKVSRLRNAVQLMFALLVVYVGLTFTLFVNAYLHGTTPVVSRPGGVEGFLPISALVAFKAWLATGQFDKIHPAGLIIFLTIVTISLLFKKAFCAWLCPIGTLSEGLAGLGRKFFGQNFKLPKALDYPLRAIKYLLLLFFVNIILLGMDGVMASGFLTSNYNLIADVKMLQFFEGLSGTALLIVGLLVIASVFIEHFWCRYLCPYGALLGIVGLLSPFKVTREEETCTGCGACTRACPNRIEVAKAKRVWSPECTSCLNCVNSCPAKGALAYKPPLGKLLLSPKYTAAAIIATWLIFVIAAKATGHWDTAVTGNVYRQLIPLASQIGH